MKKIFYVGMSLLIGMVALSRGAISAAADTEKSSILEQSFEDRTIFDKLTPFGYTTVPAENAGRWGIFRKNSDAVAVVGETASHGNYSLRVIRRGAASPDAAAVFSPVRKAVSLVFSVRTDRNGCFRVSVGEYRAGRDMVAGALAGAGGKLLYRDESLDGLFRSGAESFEPDVWTRFVFRFDPRGRRGEWFRNDRGTLRKIGESKLPAGLLALQEIRFSTGSEKDGATVWFDDIGIVPVLLSSQKR